MATTPPGPPQFISVAVVNKISVWGTVISSSTGPPGPTPGGSFIYNAAVVYNGLQTYDAVLN